VIDILLKHHGIDWAATVLTIIGLYLLGNKRHIGFLVMISANLVWGILAIKINSIAMIVANVVIIVMNLRGYLKWANEIPDEGKSHEH